MTARSLSKLLLAASIALATPHAIHAQTTPAPAAAQHARGDIAGDWQGTLVTPNRSLRTIFRITKTDKGWSGKMYSIDQGAEPITISSVTFDGSALKCAVDLIGGAYQGNISSDGNTITGTWTQGPTPLPLTLTRPTKETAWEIPAPPPPPKMMAADANPSFDVATVKSSDPNQQGKGFSVRGRNFSTRNTTLDDLLEFAYDVHVTQIVSGPDWMDKDKFDIAGVPDKEGTPSYEQWKSMLQKLIADRFKLTFHKDKKELSVYVLTVGKNGPKNLTKSESTAPGFSIPIHPATGGIMMSVRNGTMTNFAVFGLQGAVLDRPVLDHTGLPDRYDFAVTWMPDDSQFGGRMHLPPPTGEPAPGLFTAVQEQLGLKLEAMKAPADVLVIDHVEKPSPN